jgi:hypothetical protein
MLIVVFGEQAEQGDDVVIVVFWLHLPPFSPSSLLPPSHRSLAHPSISRHVHPIELIVVFLLFLEMKCGDGRGVIELGGMGKIIQTIANKVGGPAQEFPPFFSSENLD